MQQSQRPGCKPQLIIAIICLIILAPAAILGTNALARNNPLALGLLIGLALGLVILISVAVGSLWSAWLMRAGASIARDVVKSRSASDKAMSAVMKGAFQAMGERLELPQSAQWGHGSPFPMIEAPERQPVDDDGFVA